MRLEQRIGRVDRIGQAHAVRAANFVCEDSVEYRVREVLEEKLAIILDEFGIDKTGDVLDSAQAGQMFDDLFEYDGPPEAPLSPAEARAILRWRSASSYRQREHRLVITRLPVVPLPLP